MTVANESTLKTVLILFQSPESELAKAKKAFDTVYYYPDISKPCPADELAQVDVIFTDVFQGIPPYIESLAMVPKLRLIQNSATGVERIVQSKMVKSATPEQLAKIHFANGAGGYSLGIATFVLNYITGLYNLIPEFINIQKNEKRWGNLNQINSRVGLSGPFVAKSIYGKTFGFLGYGSLGREFARYCSIFPKSRLIAANSEGVRKADDTFVFEGAGDTEGKLPEAFYSTKDPRSLKAFISQCDVLISSLPSTKQTTGLLDAEKLGWMKPDGIFINVGRGTLIKNEEILKALDNGLWGAAVDVTDPEPLPEGHPLWSHPRVMITPHASGEAENEMGQSFSILFRNKENVDYDKPLYNTVSYEKGY